MNKIYNGDCLEILTRLPDEFIDLIVTSPPYADKRKHTYGGVKPEMYCEWFLPRSLELFRVLKTDGSFVLNIKEGVKLERQTYVLELILALREQGWIWTEEYIWHKINAVPGKYPNRFRDAWERCLHFTKAHKFNMYQDNVKVPAAKGTLKIYQRIKEKGLAKKFSGTDSGLQSNIPGKDSSGMVLPSNVICFGTENKNLKHSAAFPQQLPAWFIKLFTKKGDIVLDPFIGSGTTALAAMQLSRQYVGIDIHRSNMELARQRIAQYKATLN